MSANIEKKSVSKIISIILIVLIITATVFIAGYDFYQKKVFAATETYLKSVYKIERGYIENIPIYTDFANSHKEQQLRTFLLKDHLEIAKLAGVSPVIGDDAITDLVAKKKLTFIDVGKEKLFFFYNVRKKYRYLTPATVMGLELVTQRFQENIEKRKKLPPVKLAISSALRPLAYQRNLMGRNNNATFVSTHCYGVSFDIFFDDYFVSLPELESSDFLIRNIQIKLRQRFGFLMGDALRRQFRAVLMETLLQLQEEGKIYAILERRQRCYHVTVPGSE